MTTDPKAPFPFEELYRQGMRGVDHARRVGRMERSGMNHTVTTCGMSLITFAGATTASLAVTHGHPKEPCITLSPRPGGNLLYNFIMQVEGVNADYFMASATCLAGPVTGELHFSWVAAS